MSKLQLSLRTRDGLLDGEPVRFTPIELLIVLFLARFGRRRSEEISHYVRSHTRRLQGAENVKWHMARVSRKVPIDKQTGLGYKLDCDVEIADAEEVVTADAVRGIIAAINLV